MQTLEQNSVLISRGEQRLFINTNEIPGVQSCVYSYSLGVEPIRCLGSNGSIYLLTTANQGSLSISTLLFSATDYLGSLTGINGFNAFIIPEKSKVETNFSLVSGYATSYKSSCSVGEVPKIDLDATFFGECGRIPKEDIDFSYSVAAGQLNTIKTVATPSDNLIIVGFGGIEVRSASLTTDLVQGFSLDISVDRSPIYGILDGSQSPKEVKTNLPSTVQLQINLLAKNFVPNNTRNYPKQLPQEDVSVIVKDYESGQQVLSYSFANMILARVEQSIDKDGELLATLIYQSSA